MRSNNIAELNGILHVIVNLLDVGFPFDVQIFTDSSKCIRVISRTMEGKICRCNNDLLSQLQTVLNMCSNRIVILKTRAHIGIMPNEVADQLSKIYLNSFSYNYFVSCIYCSNFLIEL